MRNELTNLLPFERQRALMRDYFLRTGVVGALLLSALVLVAAVLLLPTYQLLSQSMSAKQARLSTMESRFSSSSESTLSARLTALTEDTAILAKLADVPSVSTIIRDLLATPRPGIALSGLVYAAADQASSGTLAVSGTAKTRESLRNYQLALQGASFARAAALPVSAYAKDSDISFTISITLAP